jgi:uncharacterized protein YciI
MICFWQFAYSQDQEPEQKFSMQVYFFVLLTTGPNTSTDTAELSAAFNGHMKNIKAMHKAGKLKLAGPFAEKGDLRGIFIIDAASEDEVKELLSHDEALAAGFLTAEIKRWYGPKGLTVIPDE